MITIYRLEQPGSCDGRGPNVTVGFFAKIADARQIGESGFMNLSMQGPDPRIYPVIVYESMTEFCVHHPKYVGPGSKEIRQETLRANALAKLSLEEREALGIG